MSDRTYFCRLFFSQRNLDSFGEIDDRYLQSFLNIYSILFGNCDNRDIRSLENLIILLTKQCKYH